MSGNNGHPVRILDLANPKQRQEFLDHIVKLAIESVSSKLGIGFTCYDQKTIPFQKDMVGIWNAVALDLTQYDKFDIIIDKLIEDMVKTKVNHFIRLPASLYHRTAEKNGIFIRAGLELHPRPMLYIDYKGWSETKK